MLILYLVAEKNPLSKTITPELSLNLQNIIEVNSGIAKTSSVDNNQELDDGKESEISWAASSYGDV